MPSVPSNPLRIAIVGAGIGGLTTAIALQKKGIYPRIFEATPELRPAGAGIILAMNATQVYQRLGILKEIERSGWQINAMHLTDSELKSLSYSDMEGLSQELGAPTVAIHRAALQSSLLEALSPEVEFNTNRRLKGMKIRNDEVELTFNDGHPEKFDLVIGADGIHSVVRQALGWGKGIRSAGQACWRGIAPVALQEVDQHHFYEAWGKGARFGFGQIDAERTYWFAVVRENLLPRSFSGPTLWKGNFTNFHPEVQRLLAETPEESILRNDIEDLNPLEQWQRPGVVLVGDAAHATTPNMGQGACQAVEDAFVLAECLADNDLEVTAALAKFESIRMPRAKQVVKNSWRLGQMAHWSGGMSVRMRNTLMRMVPGSSSQKAMKKMLTLPF